MAFWPAVLACAKQNVIDVSVQGHGNQSLAAPTTVVEGAPQLCTPAFAMAFAAHCHTCPDDAIGRMSAGSAPWASTQEFLRVLQEHVCPVD